MSRLAGLVESAARQRGEVRLAQLSDDNAFVDVEAVLGAHSGLGSHGGSTSAASSGGARAKDKRATDHGTGSSTGAVVAPGHSNSTSDGFLDADERNGTGRVSSATAALLASRVALSASLVEQHKAYLRATESVKKLALQVLADADDEDDECDPAVSAGAVVKTTGDATRKAQEGEDRPLAEEASGKSRGRRAGGKRQRDGEEKSKRVRSPTSPSPTRSVKADAQTATPILATSLLASWSGRQPLMVEALSTVSPIEASRSSPPSTSSSASCMSGSSTADVLQAAHRELVLIEQWKRWVLSPPAESEFHRLAQSPTRADSSALLIPSWQALRPPPLLWPVLAHLSTTCPSHHALIAAPVKRVPASAAQASSKPFDVTAIATTHMTRDERCEADICAWLGIGPSLLSEDVCDGARQNHLCAVCLLPAAYRCVRCKAALVCSIDCHVVHDATRCLKFLA